MNGYKLVKSVLSYPQPQKMSNKLVTQPHCALTLREIMTQFSNGEVTVRAHMPTNDFVDNQTNEEFDQSGNFQTPNNFEDEFEAREFLLNQKEIVESAEETPVPEQNETVSEQKNETKSEESQEKGDENK